MFTRRSTRIKKYTIQTQKAGGNNNPANKPNSRPPIKPKPTKNIQPTSSSVVGTEKLLNPPRPIPRPRTHPSPPQSMFLPPTSPNAATSMPSWWQGPGPSFPPPTGQTPGQTPGRLCICLLYLYLSFKVCLCMCLRRSTNPPNTPNPNTP